MSLPEQWQNNQTPQNALDFSNPQTIETIRRTVARGASNEELDMFLHLCNQYQLDPFRKEIWFVKYDQDSPTIMTSRDGYLKIAQEHPEYEGIMSQEVRANDHFKLDAANGTVHHEFASPMNKRGEIVGAWATVYRKNKRPVSIFVNYSEYKGNSPVWRKYPSAMIIKVAESFVLKRQFGITGLVTREELDSQQAPAQPDDASQGRKDVTPPPEPPVEDPQDGQATPPYQESGSENEQNQPALDTSVPEKQDLVDLVGNMGLSKRQVVEGIMSIQRQAGSQNPIQEWDHLSDRAKIVIYDTFQSRFRKMLNDEQSKNELPFE